MARNKKRRRPRREAPDFPHLRAEEFAELERLAAEASDRGETFSAVLSVEWSLPR